MKFIINNQRNLCWYVSFFVLTILLLQTRRTTLRPYIIQNVQASFINLLATVCTRIIVITEKTWKFICLSHDGETLATGLWGVRNQHFKVTPLCDKQINLDFICNLTPQVPMTTLQCDVKKVFPSYFHDNLIEDLCTTEVKIQSFIWLLSLNTTICKNTSFL